MTPEPHFQVRPRTRTARRVTACYRHPSEPVTGFCPSCLSERLAGLDPSGLPVPSSSSTSSTGFLQQSRSNRGDVGTSSRSSAALPSSSFSPELRRCKSVSVVRCGGGVAEPRRKSCDVGVKNSLCYLFSLDDENLGLNGGESKVESKNIGFSSIVGPVHEFREEEEEEEVDDNDDDVSKVGEIRVSEDVLVPDANDDGDGLVPEEEVKTMREHIDLEWQSRKQKVRDLRDIASVFSQKLRKWRQKQKDKAKKRGNDRGVRGIVADPFAMRVDRPIGLQFRDTQSEIADYGFGRRSCDTEPRFSVDAGRMSVDDSRFSCDEPPRASWDGYLVARTIPRLTPMLSAVENVMLVNRSDNQRMGSVNKDESSSGGSAQTNSDSSSQGQSSSDRSSSGAKALGLEVDEMKTTKVFSPANANAFHGTKLVITERELKDWHLNLTDNNSDSVESVPKDATCDTSGSSQNVFKKSSGWVSKIWGFIHGLSDSKYDHFTANQINHSLADPGEKQGVDQTEKGASNGNFNCSSSYVDSKDTTEMVESYYRTRSVVETRGSTKKAREELVLERNKSSRYSPSNADNGPLRFHLTPFRSYKSNKSGRNRLKNSHSVSRNVLN